MKLRILGCSGGIGGGARTTSMLLDQDTLIDAGTGVVDLSVEELRRIDHVFVTHSHLDHVCSIPLLVDALGGLRGKALSVYATRGTLNILKAHLFNWKLWPDFTVIPRTGEPFMRYVEVRIGETIDLGGRRITPVPANHVVPAVGYRLDSGRASLVFTGDTTSNDRLWPLINAMDNLRYLIIETAFTEPDRDIAVASKHLCPSLLAEELRKLERPAEIFVTHVNPSDAEATMAEIARLVAAPRRPRMLENGQEFEF